MTRSATEAVGRVLAGAIGLRSDGSAGARLERTVAERARARGIDVAAYVEELAADRDELERLIDAVTVQESRFFRDPVQFTVLRRLLETLPATGAVWSAGCANGEEAWSLAMLLAEAGATAWRVVATDASGAALARTRAGVYAERELTGLSRARRARFMERAGDGWRIGDALRARVLVRRHRLPDPPPAEAAGCRVVFCRNVLIYLRPEAAERALAGIAAGLPDDGRLFLGGGEALPPGTAHFTPERVGSAYVYRPSAAAAAPAPAPGPAPPPVRAGDRPGPPATDDTRVNLALARARVLGDDAG